MAKKADTWMPFYPGDYLRDTGHLATIEHGAYLLLITHYWVTGAALPDDDSTLMRITRTSPREWKAMRAKVRAFFHEAIVDGKRVLTHNRIEREIVRAKSVTEARAKSGSIGGQTAQQNRSNRVANATANGEANLVANTQASAEQKSTQSHSPSQKPEVKRDDDARAANLLGRICQILGIDLQADPQRITWKTQVFEMLRDGIPELDIIAATDQARVRGIKTLAYIRAVALNPAKQTPDIPRKNGNHNGKRPVSDIAAELIADIRASKREPDHREADGAGDPLRPAGHERRGISSVAQELLPGPRGEN